MNAFLKIFRLIMVIFQLCIVVSASGALLRIYPKYSTKWWVSLVFVIIALPLLFVCAIIGQRSFEQAVDKAYPPKDKTV